MPIENKKYKDTVFRMLFNNKIHLLELYNAINGTHYTNPDDLTITTLSGETFLKMKNDLSFIIAFELNIFEDQSTQCPNIPLRDLYYLAANLKDLFPSEKLYGSTVIRIPTPRFFVFYNGITTMEDKVTYRLSDMFAKKVESPSVELTVTALNINSGHNKDLMAACKVLKGYSIFVDKVRKYKHEAEVEYDSTHTTPLKLLADKNDTMNHLVAQAVTKAIDECIRENTLRDFFTEYRKEIIEVGVHEYSYERHVQAIQDESYNNGYNTGYGNGFDNGFDNGHSGGVTDTNDLYAWLKSQNRQSDILKAIDDSNFLSQLFEEYDEWKRNQPNGNHDDNSKNPINKFHC